MNTKIPAVATPLSLYQFEMYAMSVQLGHSFIDGEVMRI